MRGRLVGAAFDESGNLWAYALLDDTAPLVSPYGVTEYSGWPMDCDEFVTMVQGWHLAPTYNGIALQSGQPVFVYAQLVPEPADG